MIKKAQDAYGDQSCKPESETFTQHLEHLRDTHGSLTQVYQRVQDLAIKCLTVNREDREEIHELRVKYVKCYEKYCKYYRKYDTLREYFFNQKKEWGA